MTGTGKALITLDLDGVICDPILSRNVGISADFLDPAAAPRPARVPPRWFSTPTDWLRFDFRRPIAGVEAALRELHEIRTVYLLTGRRSSPEGWLRRHGLLQHLDRVIVNEGALRSPHYKLRALEEVGAAEHVDDDGRTAQLLATGDPGLRVFLCDWPRNRGPEYAPNVTRLPNLAAVVAQLRAEAGR